MHGIMKVRETLMIPLNKKATKPGTINCKTTKMARFPIFATKLTKLGF